MTRYLIPFALAAISYSPNAFAQDGPSCAGEACFLEAVRTCQPATFEPDDGAALGGRARYEVLGWEGGACQIGFAFTANPDPALVDTPMSFLVTPDGASRETLLEAVESCLLRRDEGYDCTGPLAGRLAPASQGPEMEAGTGPMPCGQTLAETQPPLYPMPRDGKWGYVDRQGQWRIAPQWDRAKDFHEGRAAVGSSRAWGIIDRAGNFVVEMRHEGQSTVTIDGERWVTSPFTAYAEGCTVATLFTQSPQRPFFVDRDGKTYWRDTLPQALQGRDIEGFGGFSEGLAWFQEGLAPDARFGWIDAGGEVRIAAEFVEAGRFSGGLAPASSRDGQAGFISPEGQLQLPRKWTLDDAAAFSEGLARVWTGPFDTAFMTEEDFAFDRITFGAGYDGYPDEAEIAAAGDFHDGLAPVRIDFDGRRDFVYVDREGAVAFVPNDTAGVTLCFHQRLPEFHNGLVRLIAADTAQGCTGPHPAGMADYADAHYIYLDTNGDIALRQEK